MPDNKMFLEITTDMLTTAVHNMALIPPPAPDAATFVTDLSIRRVVPLRGDEPDKMAHDHLVRLGVELTEEPRVYTRVGASGGQQLKPVAATFLLVSVEFRVVSLTDLDQTGTSDNAPVNVFDWPDQTGGTGLGPLLFRVIAPGPGLSSLQLRFETVFNPLTVALRPQVVQEIKGMLPDISLPLPVDQVVKLLRLAPTMGVRNVGAKTQVWDPTTREPKGLCIGVDVGLPDYSDGWVSFYGSSTWGLVGSEAWGAFLSKDLLEAVGVAQVDPQINKVPSGGTVQGNVRATWTGMVIEVLVSVSTWPISFPLGNAKFAMTPFFKREEASPGDEHSYLAFRVCSSFDLDPGFYTAPIGLIPGGLFTSIVGAIVAAQGRDRAQAKLKEIEGEGWGHPDQEGCRERLIKVELQLASVGTLTLARVAAREEGLQLGGEIENAIGLLPPAKLEIYFPSGWSVPWGPCRPPNSGDPERTLFLNNAGKMTLVVQAVENTGPPGTAFPEILEIVETLALPAWIDAGGGLRITVRARVTPDPSIGYDPHYNPDNPPPLRLRLISNGGGRVIDLNADSVARPTDPVAFQLFVTLADKLCGLARTVDADGGLRLPPGITYTDPIPFDVRDRVRERIALRLSGLPERSYVEMLGADGWPAGRVYVHAGTAHVIVDGLRGPASTHQVQALSGRLSRGRPAAWSRTRLLYREGRQFQIGASILGAGSISRQLIVLTESGLWALAVTSRGVGSSKMAPIAGACGLAIRDGRLLVVTPNGAALLDGDLDGTWYSEVLGNSCAATEDAFWIGAGDAVHQVEFDSGRFRRRRTVELPGVSDLIGVGDAAFALAGGELYEVGACPRPLGVRARSLTLCDGWLAAETEDGFLLLDRSGRRHAVYPERPWFASLVEWPDLAIELRRDSGVIVLHERYETYIDPESFPAPTKQRH